MRRISVLTCTLAALSVAGTSPAFGQTTEYGGGPVTAKGTVSNTSMGLVRHADGTVTGRMSTFITCKNTNFPNTVFRLKGTLTGEAFTVTGGGKLSRNGRAKVSVSGTFSGESASGVYRFSTSKFPCASRKRNVVLRVPRQPVGAAALPAARSVFAGITSQRPAASPTGLLLGVTASGQKVTALWAASMRCGPTAVVPALNYTPGTTIRADGTFSRTETYTIRYRGGLSDRFRVTFAGRFLADGATGTLRARMTTRQRGKRFYPCDSGVQTWSATR